MGFLNALGKAVDLVDNAVTDARTRHGANADADRFADTVQLHKTYYTVVVHQLPWGGQHKLIHEHIAKGRSRITGEPMFGHMSASQLWLTHGPVFAERPSSLQTLREYSDKRDPGPDIRGHISDY